MLRPESSKDEKIIINYKIVCLQPLALFRDNKNINKAITKLKLTFNIITQDLNTGLHRRMVIAGKEEILSRSRAII
jgi:hypothetical protein